MTDKIDELIREIAQLNETIREHKSDPATLDMDALKTAFAEVQAELIRRGQESRPSSPDDFVGPPEMRVYNPIVQEGKFAGLRAGDLAFTAMLLKQARMVSPQVKPPSEELMKALTATGSGTGDELVPTGWAAELWKDIFADSLIVGNLSRVPMPTDPYELPLGLGSITFRKGTEATATTATDMATAKVTMTATELVGEVDWSYSLDEDAVIAMLPALRDQIRIDAASIMDAFALNADATNADTGNINSDDANPDDDSYYLSAGQDGIRHLWLVDNTSQGVNAGGDALTDTDILNALKLLGKYAQRPDRLVMVCDFSTYIKGIMGLTNVQTIDKYGPKAAVITGEIAKYRGVPIVPSAVAPLTEADGKCSATASNNTLGQISIFHRDMWRVGFRRELLIEVDRDIQSRKLIMVVSFRIAVAAHGTRSSATHTAGIYNILV